MKKKSKLLLLITIFLMGSLFVYAGITYAENNRKPYIDDSEYQVSWVYKEGQIIELDETDLLYDMNDTLINPAKTDKSNSYYNLPSGEYRLVKVDYEEDIIKIIVE